MILSVVFCTIQPGFCPIARLFIVDPIPLVISALKVDVETLAKCPVVLSLALVDIAIRVYEPPISICFSINPEPFIETTIPPHHLSPSILLAVFPLAFVHLFILNFNKRFQLWHPLTAFLLIVLCVVERLQLLVCFFRVFIMVVWHLTCALVLSRIRQLLSYFEVF